MVYWIRCSPWSCFFGNVFGDALSFWRGIFLVLYPCVGILLNIFNQFNVYVCVHGTCTVLGIFFRFSHNDKGGFFAKVSDSAMGGTYLTLLNTVSNLGGTWPKFPILYLIDFFSVAHCEADGTVLVSLEVKINTEA